MSCWWRNSFLCGVFLLLAHVSGADVMVQLNINRPINDVSDKFVSFTIKPEDLYTALDSSKRKTITRMAAMLSHSHIKFVGDYYFAAKNAGIRLRNPTKIVWKGFNKWTKAVNWSMIIPVPYKPDSWDPMDTLKILNTSQMVDIDEAIWQLGTDFGTSRAADYVSELKTFNIMVDSFKHTFTKWQTMGADISAGSSPEETRRYVEMSRDLNAAYGWIQSENIFSSNSVGSSLDDLDPALKVLFKSKVPVWLTLPKRKTLSLLMDSEIIDGLSWAQTMGETANIGFESIFKPLTLDDMEEPKFDFYVTALFKKIMGSRVYPARPLGLFDRKNKLYTHCANMVSGGLAFMVVNKQEQPLQIAIRSMNNIQETEVWQYTLTMQNGQVLLNDNNLYINSSLMPEVSRKTTNSMLQLKTPGLSVSFWVLPNANLEHCHFTEVETSVDSAEFNNKNTKRYSSSDRLLKELIKESTKPSFSPFGDLIRRQRRSLDGGDDRFKRFVLEGAKEEGKPFVNFAGNLVQEIKSPLKRDIFTSDGKIAALEWLENIFKEPISFNKPLLKRNARQSDLQKGPFFMTRDGRRTAFTKKITEIKKPERKAKNLPVEDQEFDEEKFFKNVADHPEPEYVRIPEGDVFLSNIASVDGDEEELTIETKGPTKERIEKKEIVNEMKPLRLLPTEFFESLPPKPIQPLPPANVNIGSALNSLLYSDPFGKNTKNFYFKDTVTKEIVEPENRKGLHGETDINYEDNAAKGPIDMVTINNRAVAEDDEEGKGRHVEILLEAAVEKTPDNTKDNYNSYLPSDDVNYFGVPIKTVTEKGGIASAKKTLQIDTSTKGKYDEIPWWDLSPKRSKRSLNAHDTADSWRNNMISKHEDPIAAAVELSPARLRHFENKVDEVVRSTNNNGKTESDDDNDDDLSIGKRIVMTFKDQVIKLVDIFTHHANEWYNTFSKQLGSAREETTTTEGNHIV